MGSNRYSTPIGDTPSQTYVSQYVAAPFEHYARQNAEKQGIWDTSEKDSADVLAANTDAIDYEGDIKEEYLTKNYRNKVDELLKTYGNDYGAMASNVAKLKTKLGSDQALLQFSQNLKLKQEHDKAIRASKMSASAKDNAIKQSDYDFQKIGGSFAGADYQGRGEYDSDMINKKAMDHAARIQANIVEDESRSGNTVRKMDNGDYTVFTKDGTYSKTINAADAANRLYGSLSRDTELMSNLRRKYEDHRHALGEEISDDDFNKYIEANMNSELSGVASSMGNLHSMSETKHTTDDQVKETRGIYNSATGEKIKPIVPVSFNVDTPTNQNDEFLTDQHTKLTNTGTGLRAALNKTIGGERIGTAAANKVTNNIFRLLLGKPSNYVLNQADENKINRLIATGDPATIKQLGLINDGAGNRRIRGDQVKAIIKTAQTLHEASEVSKLHFTMYENQVLRTLSDRDKKLYRSRNHDMVDHVWDLINDADASEKAKRGTTTGTFTSTVGGVEQVGKDGQRHIVGGANLQDIFAKNSSAAGNLFEMKAGVREDGSTMNVAQFFGLDLLTDKDREAAMSKIIEKAAISSEATDDSGNGRMIRLVHNGNQIMIPASVGGTSTSSSNTLNIGMNLSDAERTTGKVNQLKSASVKNRSVMIPGTDLVLSTLDTANPDGPVDNFKILDTDGHLYNVYTDNVDNMLAAFVKASPDEAKKLVAKLRLKYKQRNQ